MARARENEELTKEQRKAILDERAAFLAQASVVVTKRDNQIDVLELLISQERFAIEARFVREASKLFTLTPLPCTPEFVLGLINFRGQILPLLDLRGIFELKEKTGHSEVQVVVVQTAMAQAGIAVDEIAGITSITETELQSPKQLLPPALAGFFKGVRSDRLALIDVEKLFNDPRLIVDQTP